MVKSETLYRKVGSRYVPVEERELNFYGTRFPEGFSITYCKPGSTLTRFRINPSNLELSAALMTIEDRISNIVYETFQTKRPEMTQEQVAAWQKFIECGGTRCLTIPSAGEVAQQILEEIKKLCSN